MKLKDYQIKSTRTCPDKGILNLPHMVMGMCSELNEIEDAINNDDIVNLGEEIADVYWYYVNYLTFRGKTTDDFPLHEKGINRMNKKPSVQVNSMFVKSLSRNISLLTDLVKKNVMYNKNIPFMEEHLYIKSIHNSLITILVINNLKLPVVLQNNYDKLYARFPDGYTDKKANNRDLDKERKELEKNQ